jgi:hypothetical protein
MVISSVRKLLMEVTATFVPKQLPLYSYCFKLSSVMKKSSHVKQRPVMIIKYFPSVLYKIQVSHRIAALCLAKM